MDYHKKLKNLFSVSWSAAAFAAYSISTLFMVFYSVTAIQVWSYPWNRVSILLACLVPFLLVSIWKIPDWIHSKRFKKEFLSIAIIIFFGLLNVIYSEDRPSTLKAMVLFLASGIMVFWVSSYVLNTRFRQIIFLWLCWFSMLILSVYGLFEYLFQKKILLLSSNQIPAGALLILLLVGPLLLFKRKKWTSWLIILSTFLSIAIIILIGQRGPVLALLVISFIIGIFQWRKYWVLLPISLVLLGGGYLFRDLLPTGLTKSLVSHHSTTTRLENYFLATHIFQKKPLFGIGLNAPLKPYLSDYKLRFDHSINYSWAVGTQKALENIILSAFVEMGLFLTAVYLFFIICVLARLFRNSWKIKENRLNITLFLAPLAGFLVQSMTFDSFRYPHLSWLFHSYLGMMMNFDKFNDN